MGMGLGQELLELLEGKAFCYYTLKAIEGRASNLLRSNLDALSAQSAIALYVIQHITFGVASRIEAMDGDAYAQDRLEMNIKPCLHAAIRAAISDIDTLPSTKALIAAFHAS